MRRGVKQVLFLDSAWLNSSRCFQTHTGKEAASHRLSERVNKKNNNNKTNTVKWLKMCSILVQNLMAACIFAWLHNGNLVWVSMMEEEFDSFMEKWELNTWLHISELHLQHASVWRNSRGGISQQTYRCSCCFVNFCIGFTKQLILNTCRSKHVHNVQQMRENCICWHQITIILSDELNIV